MRSKRGASRSRVERGSVLENSFARSARLARQCLRNNGKRRSSAGACRGYLPGRPTATLLGPGVASDGAVSSQWRPRCSSNRGNVCSKDKGVPCPIRSDAVQPLSPAQRPPFSPGMMPRAVFLCETERKASTGWSGRVCNLSKPTCAVHCTSQRPAFNVFAFTSRILRVYCQDPTAWRTCRGESVAVSSCPLSLLTAPSTEKLEPYPSVKGRTVTSTVARFAETSSSFSTSCSQPG